MEHAPTNGDAIGVEHVGKMTYLSAFLQETLRLYPPVGMIPRVSRHKENLGGIEVPSNTRLRLSPHMMHRHPKIWDEPEVFRPDRWIDVSPEEQERRRFAFFPFCFGGRNCIGQYLATLEAQLIVAALIRAFCFHIAPSQRDVEHTFTSIVTMRAKPGFRFTVSKRSS